MLASVPIPKFVLASQSLQRRQALEALRLAFEVDAADLDEESIQHPNPLIRASLLATAKAEAVSQRHPEKVVIAGDTFVQLKGQTLEKPVDVAAARQMLHDQAGRTVQVYTGVAVAYGQQPTWTKANLSEATFRPLNSVEIDHYTSTQPVTTWAAAFSVAYPAGAHLLARVNGSFSAIVYGLPLEELCAYLQQQGWY